MSKNFEDSRIKKSFIIFLIILCALIFRVGYLSIYKYEDYKERIDRQSTEKIRLNSGRGIIYDRNNIRLTDSYSKNIVIIPKYVLSSDYKNINIIKKNTGLSENDILKEVQEQLNLNLIEIEVGSLSKENIKNLKQINVVVAKKTYRYRDNNLLINTIGYISKSENKGLCGIEKNMESELYNSNEDYISVFKPGQLGIQKGLDLAKGSVERVVDNAKNVKLTVDSKIQKKIENIVNKEENPTAVVVSDVSSGEILAISSRPTFNPNKIGDFLEKNNGQLQNRAISATYPAGSVFKIVVLFAALESKIIDSESYFYNCTGSEMVSEIEKLNCNNLSGHRLQNLGECFANSCNTAFYDIAKKIGENKIFEAIETLHLNQKVDISLDEEVEPIIPKDISLSNLSIGQGSLEFTPLQINQLTQIIANDGFYRHLHIYDSVVDSSFNTIKKIAYSKEDEIISPYTISKIKEFMIGVVENGTAKLLNDLDGGCGVKTGTAQSSRENKKITHGWVTGFYPEQNPKYAITVLVEGTKEKSKSALPIFKDICSELK